MDHPRTIPTRVSRANKTKEGRWLIPGFNFPSVQKFSEARKFGGFLSNVGRALGGLKDTAVGAVRNVGDLGNQMLSRGSSAVNAQPEWKDTAGGQMLTGAGNVLAGTAGAVGHGLLNTAKGVSKGIGKLFGYSEDEAQPMDKQQMLEALQQMGFDPDALQGADDAALANILEVLSSAANEPDDGSAQAMGDGDGSQPMSESVTRDAMSAALVEKGKSKEELDALTDQEIKALYDSESAAPTDGDSPVGKNAEETGRGDMTAALVEKGHSQEELDKLSDEELKQLYDAENAESADEPPAEMADQPETEQAAPIRDEMIKALSVLGHSPEELNAMTEEELKALYDETVAKTPPPAEGRNSEIKIPMKHAETSPEKQEARIGDGSGIGPKSREQGKTAESPQSPVPTGGTGIGPKSKEPATVAKHSEARPSTNDDWKDEVKKFIAEQIKEAFASQRGDIDAARGEINSEKERRIRTFAEKLRDADLKICPAEHEDIVAQLLRADTNKVHKFSDKAGKVIMKSELDQQMEALERRPKVALMAERVAQPYLRPDAPSEIAKLKNAWHRFSEHAKSQFGNIAKLIKGFKLAKQRDPGLTADKFITNKHSDD